MSIPDRMKRGFWLDFLVGINGQSPPLRGGRMNRSTIRNPKVDALKGIERELAQLNKYVSAMSGFWKLILDCKAGNQIAIAKFKEIFGFELREGV